jgi:hypothetical protein
MGTKEKGKAKDCTLKTLSGANAAMNSNAHRHCIPVQQLAGINMTLELHFVSKR